MQAIDFCCLVVESYTDHIESSYLVQSHWFDFHRSIWFSHQLKFSIIYHLVSDSLSTLPRPNTNNNNDNDNNDYIYIYIYWIFSISKAWNSHFWTFNWPNVSFSSNIHFEHYSMRFPSLSTYLAPSNQCGVKGDWTTTHHIESVYVSK